ncbi:MAG TPA: hypothetical protein GX529_02575 [Firmicutes bacterium]|nr:hypothetical protein [Candidatus Fermentithermobacillaceae bacterium]
MFELYIKAWSLRQKLAGWFNRFISKEEGATIAEYAILLAVVVVSLILVLGQLTAALKEKLVEIIGKIQSSPTN